MKKIFFLSIFLFAYLFFHAAIPVLPHPAWVKPQSLAITQSIPASEVSSGYYYMLMDEQVNVAKKSYYSHYAYKIISEAGVQNSSELNFSYNPAYEKFVFHSLKVYRNGKCIDKTHTTPIKEIQRETGFEEHLYDESMSVLMVLDDIRPGDIIEYDYSIIGANPIFEGMFYYHLNFSYAYKLLDFNLRVIKPASRKINERTFNITLTPQKTVSNGEEEIVYQAKDVKGLTMDKKTPASFNPYYAIEFSEYDTWQQVEDWALTVFAIKAANNDLLTEKIKEIKDSYPDKSNQIIAALRFVQNQIRYMGVEIGVNSHKPTAPNKVISQRYGDCKDKALLFCKILEGLDIKAFPALVSTNDLKSIKNNLVSPRLFNHCIAKVELNGKAYWFDPTLSYQLGDINHYYTPDYDVAFVIGGGKNDLDEMPQNTFSKILVEETYVVPDFSGKATFKIKTTYRGADADKMRGDVANSSTKSNSETFLNYYKNYFPEITQVNEPTTQDIDSTDEFILNEEYTINKFWEYPDSANKKKVAANIYAYMVRDKLNVYDVTFASRKMPLYFEYPMDVEQKTKLILPENWDIEIPDEIKHTEFIDYKYTAKNNKNVIDMCIEYKSLTKEIPADKAKAFVAMLDDLLTNTSGLRITYDKSVEEKPTSTTNWLMLMLFIMFFGVFIFMAIYIYRQNPKHPILDEVGLEIKNREIGGWLVLPVIGLIITPFSCIYNIGSKNYFNLQVWNSLTNSVSSTYDSLWAPGLIFELLFTTFIFVMAILLLVMLFTYDKRFPKYMVVFFVVRILSEIFTLLILKNIPGISDERIRVVTQALITLLVSSAIWIPYLLSSQRSKETFIK